MLVHARRSSRRNAKAALAAGKKPGYDRTCRDLPPRRDRRGRTRVRFRGADGRRDRRRRPREGPRRLPERRARRLHHPAHRRHADLQLLRRRRRRRHARSRTSSAATIISPTRRARSCSTRRSARRCPLRATCRSSSAPTRRGSSSGTARRPSPQYRDLGLPARRASSTISRVSAGRTAIRRSSPATS